MKIDWPVEKFCEMYGLRTKEQIELLQLFVEGLNREEMSEYLGIGTGGVDERRKKLLKATNFSNRISVMSEVYKIAMEGK